MQNNSSGDHGINTSNELPEKNEACNEKTEKQLEAERWLADFIRKTIQNIRQ